MWGKMAGRSFWGCRKIVNSTYYNYFGFIPFFALKRKPFTRGNQGGEKVSRDCRGDGLSRPETTLLASRKRTTISARKVFA
jgi:hypothetical protein